MDWNDNKDFTGLSKQNFVKLRRGVSEIFCVFLTAYILLPKTTKFASAYQISQ